MFKGVIYEINIEDLRERLCGMTDDELLRFGWIARYACSPDIQADGRDHEASVLQLHEAREEWNRRNPRLPLRESF
jgi:hypothetical protein